MKAGISPLGSDWLMVVSAENSPENDPIDALIANYMERIDRGEQIDRDAFIREHSDFADELNEFFSQQDRFANLTDQSETIALHATPTPSNELNIRCPHCHTPTSVAVDTLLVDLTCPSCGSIYSLAGDSSNTRGASTMIQVGHFELIERLGVGGFGSVWKARDTKLDRAVAVKIPRDGQMDVEETEKFLREARAAAQLQHPNIVGIHEIGKDGDTVYIVSDLVRGMTLTDWLTAQQLTNREVSELTIKIAKALHHAHEQGVIHRDLKPDNIMMDSDGEPHLMDFGLARREFGELTVTLEGQVLGTPAYMSPEQAQGEGHTANRRSDIYSFGVILFRLLTGELPFRGNPRMIMHQVIHDEPPSPRKLNANVPRELETITLKCLEKNTDKRYQSAEEVVLELERWLNGKPIHAQPISQLERAFRWTKKNPTAAALTLLLAICAVGGPTIALRQAQLLIERNHALAETESAKSKAEFAAAQANQARIEAEAEKERANKEQAETKALLEEAIGITGQYANLLRRTRLKADAEPIYRRQMELSERAGNEGAWLSSARRLAQLLMDLGKVEQSVQVWSKAIVRGRKFDGDIHSATIDAICGLAKAKLLLGDALRANSLYGEAFSAISKTDRRSVRDDLALFRALDGLQRCAAKLRHPDQADSLLSAIGYISGGPWRVRILPRGTLPTDVAQRQREALYADILFEKQLDVVSLAWDETFPLHGKIVEQVELVAEANIDISAGEYLFHAISDDGVRVWLDDNLIIGHWKSRRAAKNTASVTFKEGLHTLRIEYFQDDGEAELRFWITNKT